MSRSQRMYKSRIEQWGLRKSLTARDVPELLQQRKARNSTTTFIVVRGRQVPTKRVDQYLRRNPHMALANQNIICTDERRFISAPRSISLPGDMKWSDEIIQLLGQFIAGSCQGGSWCPDGITPTFFASQNTSTWLRDMHFAGTLLDKKLFRHAFACLDVAFDRLKRLLRDPDPTFFLYVYQTLANLPDIIRQRLTAYATEMAAILLPANHPINHICLKLNQADSLQQFLNYRSMIFYSYFDLLTRSFNYHELNFLNFSRTFYHIMYGNQVLDLNAGISKNMDIIRVQKALGGTEDDILQTKLSSSLMLMDGGNDEAAEALLEEVGQEIYRNRETPASLTLYYTYYSRLMFLHEIRGSIEDAIKVAKKQLLLSTKLYGAENSRTLGIVIHLQSLYVQNGTLDEAHRLFEILESRLELGTYLHEIEMIDEEDDK
jgi:hypothetical protein